MILRPGHWLTYLATLLLDLIVQILQRYASTQIREDRDLKVS